MTAPQTIVPSAKTVRLIYGAMVAGVVSFALVGHFLLRPAMANSGELPAVVIRVLLGVSLGAGALSLLLRRRVPRRASNESADTFWMAGGTPALLTWAALEASSLIAVFVYARTGSVSAIAIAAAAGLLFVLLNPAHLERRA